MIISIFFSNLTFLLKRKVYFHTSDCRRKRKESVTHQTFKFRHYAIRVTRINRDWFGSHLKVLALQQYYCWACEKKDNYHLLLKHACFVVQYVAVHVGSLFLSKCFPATFFQEPTASNRIYEAKFYMYRWGNILQIATLLSLPYLFLVLLLVF